MAIPSYLQELLTNQKLPDNYLVTARQWFYPLAQQLAKRHQQNKKTLYVAINGCQGSGKSTLAAFLEVVLTHDHHLKTAILSIDDFYLTKKERQALANKVHPLLEIRGVPGTHDTKLANTVLHQLSSRIGKVVIPRFNKAIDDRAPEKAWSTIDAPADIVILEGWCMGAKAQSDHELNHAINSLEETQDPDCHWRTYVNAKLQHEYAALFQQFDVWVMLKAPSFSNVYEWRLEQESKLKHSQLGHDGSQVMTPKQIETFIQHYQRVTQHCLEQLPENVHFLFTLNSERAPITLTTPIEIIKP